MVLLRSGPAASLRTTVSIFVICYFCCSLMLKGFVMLFSKCITTANAGDAKLECISKLPLQRNPIIVICSTHEFATYLCVWKNSTSGCAFESLWMCGGSCVFRVECLCVFLCVNMCQSLIWHANSDERPTLVIGIEHAPLSVWEPLFGGFTVW